MYVRWWHISNEEFGQILSEDNVKEENHKDVEEMKSGGAGIEMNDLQQLENVRRKTPKYCYLHCQMQALQI